MSARANVVLPAPRSPESVTVSPGCSELAMSTANRWVACSSGSATEKLELPGVVGSRAMAATISRRGAPGPVVEREAAGHRGTAADRRFEAYGTAVQLDEGANQRESEAGAAVARAERMGLEPVEHLALHLLRDAGPAVGDRDHHRILQPLGGESHGLAGWRKAHGIGQQIEQRLPHPALVGDEAADVGRGANFQPDAVLHQPVLHAFGSSLHGAADVDRPKVERHGAGID